MSRLRERLYGAYRRGGAASGHVSSIQDLVRRRPTLASPLARNFPAHPDTLMLDIGCGRGPLLLFACGQGFRKIVGVDVSLQPVAFPRQLGIAGVQEGNLLESLQQQPAASLFGAKTHEHAPTRFSLDPPRRVFGFSSVRCFETAPVLAGIKDMLRLGAWKYICGALRVWSFTEMGTTGREAVFTRNLLAVAIREG